MVNKGRAVGSRTAQLLPKIGVGLIANYFHIDNFCYNNKNFVIRCLSSGLTC